MMINFKSIERKQNIKLPEEYKKLYLSDLKETASRIKICVDRDVFEIRKILTLTEINDIIEEFYDFFGYDIVPIAETVYGDYICLYYKQDRKNPSVIYWNYELTLENPEEGRMSLYDSMLEFLNDVIKIASSC